MRVSRATSGIIILVVLARGVGSGLDLSSSVAGAAAASGRLAGLEDGAGNSNANEGCERDDRLVEDRDIDFCQERGAYLEEEHLVKRSVE
ncbi:unnamed protein product [Fusarium graminearum]|uniref:Secreted protein n=1 Tax=Gibberella zeae TaxID=5518 RepID=A0A4E9E792_GIBZA|nr:unnamed protein product [Fusarium graminearum]